MSRKAVVDLLAEADRDEKLRQELNAAVEDREHGQQALLAVASAHGHTFTIDEFLGVPSAGERSSRTRAARSVELLPPLPPRPQPREAGADPKQQDKLPAAKPL